MPAVATGRSSEGDESVKAEEGPLASTSIAAPARAPSKPPETRRESMLSSMTSRKPKLWLLAAELDVNGQSSWQTGDFAANVALVLR